MGVLLEAGIAFRIVDLVILLDAHVNVNTEPFAIVAGVKPIGNFLRQAMTARTDLYVTNHNESA